MTGTRATAARAAYLLIILAATLSNLGFDPSTAEVGMRIHRALDLSVHMNDVVDGARNLLLFAGLGAVWLATTRTTRPLRVIGRVTVIGLLLSTGVELLQLFSPIRHSSVLDVITDTAGTFAGAWGTLVGFDAVKARRGRPSYVGVPAFVFAACYGAAAVMESFFPLLRQNLLPNLGSSPGDRLGQAWAAVGAMTAQGRAGIPLTDIAIFFPAGIFAVAAAAEEGASFAGAWTGAAAVGAAVVALSEILHGIALVPIVPGAILVHAVSLAAGSLVAALTLDSYAAHLGARGRARLLLAAYVPMLMVWSWRPFRLEVNAQAMAAQFSLEHVIPLRALASRMDLFSVTDVIAQFVLFLPLGALLAVWPLRRAGPLRGLWPVLYLSVVLELGKIVVAERFMDVTHILIQCSGAAIGWLMIRRAGYRVAGTLLGPAEPAGPARPVPGAESASRLHEQSVANANLVAGHVVPLADLGRSGAEPGRDG